MAWLVRSVPEPYLEPPGISRGTISVSSARQGGQLLNFKSQGGDTFRGGDDFRQSSRGGTALS